MRTHDQMLASPTLNGYDNISLHGELDENQDSQLYETSPYHGSYEKYRKTNEAIFNLRTQEEGNAFDSKSVENHNLIKHAQRMTKALREEFSELRNT